MTDKGNFQTNSTNERNPVTALIALLPPLFCYDDGSAKPINVHHVTEKMVIEPPDHLLSVIPFLLFFSNIFSLTQKFFFFLFSCLFFTEHILAN